MNDKKLLPYTTDYFSPLKILESPRSPLKHLATFSTRSKSLKKIKNTSKKQQKEKIAELGNLYCVINLPKIFSKTQPLKNNNNQPIKFQDELAFKRTQLKNNNSAELHTLNDQNSVKGAYSNETRIDKDPYSIQRYTHNDKKASIQRNEIKQQEITSDNVNRIQVHNLNRSMLSRISSSLSPLHNKSMVSPSQNTIQKTSSSSSNNKDEYAERKSKYQLNYEISNQQQLQNQQFPQSLPPLKQIELESFPTNEEIISSDIKTIEGVSLQRIIKLTKKKKTSRSQQRKLYSKIAEFVKKAEENDRKNASSEITVHSQLKYVFCMSSYDDNILEVMVKELCWIHNPLNSSSLFHIKWVDNYNTNSNQLDYDALVQGQYISSFENLEELCDPCKLSVNLQEYLHLYTQFKSYFPCTYDLSDFINSSTNQSKEQQENQQVKGFTDAFEDSWLYKTLNSFIRLMEGYFNASEILQIQDFYNHRCLESKEYWIHQQLSLKIHSLNSEFDVNRLRLVLIDLLKSLQNNKYYQIPRNFIHLADISKELTADSPNDELALILGLALSVQSDMKQLFPQTNFNNLWVLKQSYKKSSKFNGNSRVILLSDDKQEIFTMLSSNNNKSQLMNRSIMRESGASAQDEQRIVVQQYIENLFVCYDASFQELFQSKFDLRQNILIKRFCPLSAFRYKHSYLHISNKNKDNSCQPVSFHQHSICKLSILKSYIQKKHNVNFDKIIQPKIDQLVITTLKSVQLKVIQRPQCFSIVQFQIALDKYLNPYLLTVVNSNSNIFCTKIKNNKDRNEICNSVELKIYREMVTSTVNLLFDSTHQKLNNWIILNIAEEMEQAQEEQINQQIYKLNLINSQDQHTKLQQQQQQTLLFSNYC